MAELAVAGPAPGSWKNFMTQSKKYQQFCETLRLWPFPMCETRLCWYITFLTLSLTSHGSVQSYVNGVRKLFAYAKTPWMQEGPYVKLVLDGVKRVLDHVVVHAEPMTPKILLSISELVREGDLNEVVCFTAMLVSFCLFLRSSNVVSPSGKKYSQNKQLSRRDLRMADNMVLVHIKWSKTKQYLKDNKLLVPLIRILDNRICPIQWLNRMLLMCPGRPEDPALWSLITWGN